MTESGWRPWRAAMDEALYGARGFYRSAGAPGRHFRTAAHASALWAAGFAELARRVDAALGSPAGMTVVDLGAGGGELLAGLAGLVPGRVGLIGVDVAPRPQGLPQRVHWSHDLPREIVGLLVAVEWLDVVPVDVVEVDPDARPRLVEVDPAGAEQLGGAPDPESATWLQRWWPVGAEPGRRAEIGTTRDRAWTSAVASLASGLAVAVDYSAEPGRDLSGTLTGYRNGRVCRPVPDGSMDLTASVHFGSLAAAGDRLLSQRDALRGLGIDGQRPGYGGDPASYLGELARASAAAELLDPAGLGGFTWLVHPVGLDTATAQSLVAGVSGEAGSGSGRAK